MKSDFWTHHIWLYIVLLAGLIFVYLAKNPLYWQFYISGGMILITIVICIWYGPKEDKKPGKS